MLLVQQLNSYSCHLVALRFKIGSDSLLTTVKSAFCNSKTTKGKPLLQDTEAAYFFRNDHMKLEFQIEISPTETPDCIATWQHNNLSFSPTVFAFFFAK